MYCMSFWSIKIHFAIMPQIATYFATNCYLFCRHNACCQQVPIMSVIQYAGRLGSSLLWEERECIYLMIRWYSYSKLLTSVLLHALTPSSNLVVTQTSSQFTLYLMPLCPCIDHDREKMWEKGISEFTGSPRVLLYKGTCMTSQRSLNQPPAAGPCPLHAHTWPGTAIIIYCNSGNFRSRFF